MPYIASKQDYFTDAGATQLTMPIPKHQTNDILIAIVVQRQYGEGITVSEPNWTQIGTSLFYSAHRQVAYWKLAESSNESTFIANSTRNDIWNGVLIVVRGANTTNPINQNAGVAGVNDTDFLETAPLTTTENGTLLIDVMSMVFSYPIIPDTKQIDLICISKRMTNPWTGAGCTLVSGYRNQLTAGEVPIVKWLLSTANSNGSARVIAIADANPSNPQPAPFCNIGHQILYRYGHSNPATTTQVSAFGRHDGYVDFEPNLTNVIPNEFDDMLVYKDLSMPLHVGSDSQNNWSQSTRFGAATSDFVRGIPGEWIGVTHPMPVTDFRNKLFTLQIKFWIGAGTWGAKGAAVLFQDTNNNWACFRLRDFAGSVSMVKYTCVIDVEKGQTIGNSITPINWSSINRIAYFHHRRGTSVNQSRLDVNTAALLDKATIFNGCENSPVNFDTYIDAMHSWEYDDIIKKQGTKQYLPPYHVQIGDGSTKTVAEINSTSIDYPFNDQLYNVNEYHPASKFSLKLSPNDKFDYKTSLNSSEKPQDFVIDSASSSLATTSFAGLAIIGKRVINNANNFVMNDVFFQQTYGITLNGGKLNRCTIEDTKLSPALITNNPSNIYDCRFISSGSGHAIEISSTGTFDFVNNQFVGYGDDDTNNSAIYNNSGGLVTLNIPSGQQIPTIKDGVDSVTIIESPPLQVTLQANVSLVGAEIRIYDASSGTGDYKGNELDGVESCLTSTYSFSLEGGTEIVIQIMKDGYIEYVMSYMTPNVSTTLPIFLGVDENV